MVNAKLFETVRHGFFFSPRPSHFDFLDYKAEASKFLIASTRRSDS